METYFGHSCRLFETRFDFMNFRVVLGFDVADGKPYISDMAILTKAGREVPLTYFSYDEQLELMKDGAHVADNHIKFYKQELVEWHLNAQAERNLERRYRVNE